MAGIAKAILIAMVISIGTLLFSNLMFFFPWYMTLVVETFNVSQIVASDNYLKESEYRSELNSLKSRPLFNKNPDSVEIYAYKGKNLSSDELNAMGDDEVSNYEDKLDWEKPYQQRGKPVTVEIHASYPLRITLWGKEYKENIPVSFKLTTIGLKHYKDLDYYFDD